MDFTKRLLVKLGPLCGDRVIHKLSSAVSYLQVGFWMAANGFRLERPVRGREDLFDALAEQIADRQVLYLEFGVAFGDSMRYWSRRLRNESSHLHGFDSFEGLPAKWNPFADRGTYSTGGVPPELGDPRVQFFKGLFEETLPHYAFPDYEVLVVNIDCDLYASAAFVLKSLPDRIRPGVYLYFDEFCDWANEARALDEFIACTGRRFRLLGATATFRHVLFQCVG